MNIDPKRSRFHETLISILYPPQSPPPQPQPAKDEPAEDTLGALDPEFHVVDAEESEKEKSYGEGSECGIQKLTRAQRKRLRKRKLKESASFRRKIIGPLLPSGYEDIGEAKQTDQQNKKA